ncbi:hypothetical protein D3C75_417060 [compost metagenome]|jgi:hypothetical protein
MAVIDSKNQQTRLDPAADEEQSWPRDFDFSQARAEQQELLDMDDAQNVVSTPLCGADTDE